MSRAFASWSAPFAPWAIALAGCATSVGLAADEPSPPGESPFTPTRPGDAGTCQEQCSVDLHSRVCGDDVLETCPPDKGCGTTGCVSPCDAASENQSATGCEYFALRLPTQHSSGAATSDEGDCFAVVVVNTWNAPVSLAVERAGISYDPTAFARIPSGRGRDLTFTPLPEGKLPAGSVAVLFLSHNPGGSSQALCPVPPAIANGEITKLEPPGYAIQRGRAFRITASAPVVAYDFLPWGAGYAKQLSASLLLPSSVWGFEYLAVDGYRPTPTSQVLPVAPGQGLTAIVARENDTEVTFRASDGSSHVEVARLDRGQYLHIASGGSVYAGSLITADKPIGVWGGSDGLVVDEYASCTATEAAHQQLPPVRAMGSEYAAVRFRNRYDGVEESPPWRIVGTVPGTELTYIPEPPPGAPRTIATGDVADFRSPGGFIVKSQDTAHPFYMAAYMETSPVFSCATGRRGGAEFVNVIATEQYLTQYRFFTDPSLSETNLVVIRRRKGDSFKDVVLDCKGPLDGWMPIGMPGVPADYEYTRVDLSRGAFEPQGQCENGVHEVHSDAPFGVTVWGWSTEAVATPELPFPSAFPYNYGISYAFAAGMASRPLNVVTLSPVVK